MQKTAANEVRVSVRTLVETALRAGDLVFGGNTQRLLEGARGHRAVQAQPGAQNEYAVSGLYERQGLRLAVHGRIDRLFPGDIPLIEEIKTSTLPLERIREDDYPLHWAQARVYAYLYLKQRGLAFCDVRLCYYELQSGDTLRFTRREGFEELEAFFLDIAHKYLARQRALHDHKERLCAELSALAFPYESFRAGQRELAAQVYAAIRDGERLLAQAPTGMGKTMAVLFPALKALGEGKCERLFYLSARGTGKAAALDAVALLSARELYCLELSARDAMCPRETRDCASACPYAIGYYDRLDAALDSLFAKRDPFTSALVRETALQFDLCPHEFSLDAALLCDLVVCDYNYVFDPRVRLQRFFSGGGGSYCLLLDEAHNLPARARDMYSQELNAAPLEAVRRAVPRGGARKTPAYLTLQSLLEALRAPYADAQPPFALEGPPDDALCRLAAQVLEHLQARAYPEKGDAGELALMLSGFLYAAARWDESMLRVYTGSEKTPRLQLFCRDAAEYLKKDLARCQSAVLFSATLSPAGFYQNLCGLTREDRFVSFPSPLPPENLCCLHLPVNTRYAAREKTLPLVAGAVAQLVLSRETGNFIAFCPSYAYLKALEGPLRELLTDTQLLVQDREMDGEERARFLSELAPAPTRRVLALAVLGGVFAEGIDLVGDRLLGAAVIGTGLPQPSTQTELLRAKYDESYADGFAYAYVYPGLCRVLQAAGRVIRTETDRGALLLLDDRYARAPYPELLPPDWRLRRVGSLDALKNELCAFWREG